MHLQDNWKCHNVYTDKEYYIYSYIFPSAEESQGEIEVKDPCACESLVEFQQATMNSLEQLTQKHIL